MAIEFRCTQCNRLLRTGDDTAGKEAKCPECGAVMVIPSAIAGTGGSSPPPSLPGGSPFGGGVPQPSAAIESGNPYQSPSPFATVGPGSPLGTPGRLDFGDVFTRTWNIFKMDWGTCVAVVVIVIAISFGVRMVAGFIPIVGGIVAFLFQTWINIGQALFFLKKARGQPVEIGEVFQGGPYFGKVVAATLLLGLIIFGIAVVCVLPMVLVGLAIGKEETTWLLALVGVLIALVPIYYITLMTSQFQYLILDKNVDIVESLTMSRDLMVGNKLTLMLIWIVGGLVGGAIALFTCMIGLLGVVPYFAMMTAVVYLIVTGQRMVEPMQPRTMA